MPNKKIALKRYHLEKLRAVHEMIVQDPQQHATIDYFALTVGANRSLLVAGFKQHYGTGIYELQVTLRLQKAKTLLQETDNPIKEIARQAGYKSDSGFRKAFKNEFGVCPSEYRKVDDD